MSETNWKRAVHCVSSQIEDALVLLNVDGGMYFSLNKSAADIWKALAKPSTESSLVDSLVGKYKVTREDCAKSVRRLLEDLSSKGLVKTVD
jgi:hypothetical protein